ncbi:ROK family protein [Protaetiibacter sp. SSC-01]|uniref:ROK family protein n=1 Tax=Protaetiibacter sp. SSC-01 TaxID=2759943 RepID=UPI0016575368|nr:ROK family protein [Protaetiibacter sp. SSC-01]QNO37906.1 ROK family protein [Protaetiibacter sp. SSC-01]
MRVGLDIGGTKTDAVAVADDGTVAHTLRLPTGFGPEAVVATAVEAVQRVSDATGTPVADFASIGIGIPGAVDPRGRVTHAVNLGLDDLGLGEELHARLGRPVRIENDVNAAAVGAFHLRGLGSGQSMAYLNLGTGLAAGLVLGGELWRGVSGVAGEIGHIPVDPSGPLCPCGQRGCLELYASGSAVARQWPSEDPLPVAALFAAAASGDPDAAAVRDRLLQGVAEAARLLVLTVDVDDVVIGGGISRLGEPLLDGVRSVIARWEAVSPFVASLGLAGRLRLLPPDFPAAAVGAALVGDPEAETLEVV